MKPPRPPIVTLTSDFGLRDSYVAEMKGSLLRDCPDAVLVDISHEIPAGNIAAGAFILERAARAFPAGTVHLAVVDPGVGGPRRALAAHTELGWLVGPDNGLLAPLLVGTAELVALDPRRVARGPVTPTFHGRDLFAPAAARLARGEALAGLGNAVDRPLPLTMPAGPRVLHVDRFGNCVTSLDPNAFPASGGWSLRAGRGVVRRRVRTYAEAPREEPVLLSGSDGRLEIAVRDGHAASLLDLEPGDPLERKAGDPSAAPPSTPRKEPKR